MKFYEKKSYNGYADKEQGKKRLKIYKKQVKERGFDDTVTWSLDRSMIEWLYPRLERYNEIAFNKIDENKLEKDVNKILEDFKFYLSNDYNDINPKHIDRFNKSLELLFKNFHTLWW